MRVKGNMSWGTSILVINLSELWMTLRFCNATGIWVLNTCPIIARTKSVVVFALLTVKNDMEKYNCYNCKRYLSVNVKHRASSFECEFHKRTQVSVVSRTVGKVH